MIKKIFLLLMFGLWSVTGSEAIEKVATIVNPVRGRELWKDNSLKPISDQYGVIKGNDFAATWLLQSDVLEDNKLIDFIKSFDEEQELGVFLEVSKNLALKSRVYFDEQRPWYDPGVVFLSAYERQERKKIIDRLMTDFKNIFGYYPKSVGAWWIDSYSLNYLEKKYKIKAALIVADQKTTDGYGVWGQWWGYPYYPDKANILVPGDSEVLVIQWALRDPEKAYFGEGPKVSNYSLQANDYLSQKLNIKYFEKLANIYFDPRNKLGQITVGLETGIESVPYLPEYKKQLEWIKKNQINDLTMVQMADKYQNLYEGNPDEIMIGEWRMTPQFRENTKLGDRVFYQTGMAFDDYRNKDENAFLDRIYGEEKLRRVNWLTSSLVVKVLLVLVGGVIAGKYFRLNWLVVGIALTVMVWIVGHVRYTVAEGEKMMGFLVDNFRFVGINFSRGVVNADQSNLVAKSMLKLNIKQLDLAYFLPIGLLVGTIYGRIRKTKKDKKSDG